MKRLKLSDLRPVFQETISAKQVFLILSYRLPIDKTKDVSTSLPFLDPSRITFRDADAFELNGMWSAFGRPEQANAVMGVLAGMGAKQKGRMNLFLDSNYWDEFSVVLFPEGDSLFFVRPDGTVAGKQVQPGTLSWRVSIQPELQQRGMVRLQLLPVYRPILTENLAKITGINSREIFFEEGMFEAYMSEGDFVVLATERFEPETNSLSRLFEEWYLKKPYALVFVIVCLDLDER